MHNSLHDGEADTRALVILRPVESLEYAEKFFGVAHVEAAAVIANEKRFFALGPHAANLHPRGWLFLRVFKRIGQKIQPHLFQKHGITETRGQVSQPDLKPPVRPRGAQLSERRLHQRSSVE